jgi:hypothetical protein
MQRALIMLVTALLSTFAANGQSIPNSFTPARNAYAKRLVTHAFRLVRTPERMPQEVRAAFYHVVPRRELAVVSQPFASTDVSDGRLRRFDFAGYSGDLWFVLYEFGGRAYHRSLIFFQHRGNRWVEVAAVIGYLDQADYPTFVRAIKAGRFEIVTDRLNL